MVGRLSVPYNKEMWVKTSKQIADYREILSQEQCLKDPIIGGDIIKPCLDHDHFDGRCRGVLSQSVNTFEGQVLKAWMKYVSEYTDISLPAALRNLADYLEKDFSGNKIHGAYLTDMAKFLKRLTVDTIRRRALQDLALVIPEGKTKTESVQMYLTEFVIKTESQIV